MGPIVRIERPKITVGDIHVWLFNLLYWDRNRERSPNCPHLPFLWWCIRFLSPRGRRSCLFRYVRQQDARSCHHCLLHDSLYRTSSSSIHRWLHCNESRPRLAMDGIFRCDHGLPSPRSQCSLSRRDLPTNRSCTESRRAASPHSQLGHSCQARRNRG